MGKVYRCSPFLGTALLLILTTSSCATILRGRITGVTVEANRDVTVEALQNGKVVGKTELKAGERDGISFPRANMVHLRYSAPGCFTEILTLRHYHSVGFQGLNFIPDLLTLGFGIWINMNHQAYSVIDDPAPVEMICE